MSPSIYLPECNKTLENCEVLKRNEHRTVYSGFLEGKKVVLKVSTDSNEVMEDEAQGMEWASDLGFAAPRVCNWTDHCLIMEHIEGNTKEALSLKEYEIAVDYLAKLHSFKNSSFRREMKVSPYCKGNLIQRLQQEATKLEPAKPRLDSTYPDVREVFVQALPVAMQAALGECVIGHGDFKADNLIFLDGQVIPVDWRDFGLAAREYDVGTLVFTERNDETVRQIVIRYLGQTNLIHGMDEKGITEFIRRSLCVAYVIMTGSNLGNLSRRNDPESLKRVEEYTACIRQRVLSDS